MSKCPASDFAGEPTVVAVAVVEEVRVFVSEPEVGIVKVAPPPFPGLLPLPLSVDEPPVDWSHVYLKFQRLAGEG